MSTPISILTEIPEELYYSMRAYLDDHPTWDQDRLFTTALSLFLRRDPAAPTPHDALEPSTHSAPPERCPRLYLEALYHQST